MNINSSRLLTLTIILNAALALVSAAWLWRPDWNGFDSTDFLPAALLLGAHQLPLLALGLGLLGAVAAAIATSYGRSRRRRPGWLVPVAVVVTIGSLSLLGVESIAAAGYTLALGMPLIAGVLLVQSVRKGGRGRWVSLVVAGLLLAVGVLTGVVTTESVGVFSEVGSLFIEQLPSLLMPALLVVLASVWTAVGAGVARESGSLVRVARWVLRHRTAITVVAALGPLPYALVRLTWLTPWKLLVPPDVELSAETVLWGMMLSTGAWLGFFLTLGLVQRWGEVFPRWVPFLAGSPVPVAFAAVPGGVVAMVLTASAVPFLMLSAGESWTEIVVGAIVFPFWLWGPVLGLAVWGYVLHRQQGRGPTVPPGSSAPVSVPAGSPR